MKNWGGIAKMPMVCLGNAILEKLVLKKPNQLSGFNMVSVSGKINF